LNEAFLIYFAFGPLKISFQYLSARCV